MEIQKTPNSQSNAERKREKKMELEELGTLTSDYTTQGNLRIQPNPYQITNGIFHRTRIKCFKICMETQKTSNSQSNIEKKTRNWRNQAP